MHLEGREKHMAHEMPFQAHVADLRRRAERDMAAFSRQSGVLARQDVLDAVAPCALSAAPAVSRQIPKKEDL